MTALSIIIPTYDTAEMTLRCVRAVLASMPAESEVIVVDDGSRDETSDLLRAEAPRVRVERLDVNRGFATAANHGVAVSRGEIVLLLNSDAFVEAGALHAIVDAFARDAKLGVAGARLRDPDGTPQWSGGRTPTLPWMIGVVSGVGHLARLVRPRNNDASREVDWVSGAAMAFRREVWRDAGPLSERFRFYCQDIELCLRARASGWTIRIVDDALVLHGLGTTIARDHPLRHDPERLWPDLLTWGATHYGRTWFFIARIALVSVAFARAAWRAIRRRDETARALMRAAKRLAQSEA